MRRAELDSYCDMLDEETVQNAVLRWSADDMHYGPLANAAPGLAIASDDMVHIAAGL